MNDGFNKIKWAEEWMKVIARIREEFRKEKPFEGMKISLAMHLEAKTAVLALTLKEGGAQVSVAGCNPLSTDDDVAKSLKEDFDLDVHAWRGMTSTEYYENLKKVLSIEPHIIIDDGGDLTTLAIKNSEYSKNLIGGNEETTTGVLRLKSMEKAGVLKFPMFDVNDALMKHLFDNRYGTGQSTLDGIMNSTNLIIAGKKVVVAGYGWCGKGIANRMKGMGAVVFVTEVDPFKAIEAKMDGFTVMPMEEAIKDADLVVTATGVKDVVTLEHIKSAKDGIILANAGHFNNEVAVEEFEKVTKGIEVRRNVKKYNLFNKKVFVLADGRLVNLAAGQGHPVEIMDLSFSIQALTARYLAKNEPREPKVYPVPEEVDRRVAEIFLKVNGIEIDKLTEEQIKYINSWEEGT